MENKSWLKSVSMNFWYLLIWSNLGWRGSSFLCQDSLRLMHNAELCSSADQRWNGSKLAPRLHSLSWRLSCLGNDFWNNQSNLNNYPPNQYCHFPHILGMQLLPRWQPGKFGESRCLPLWRQSAHSMVGMSFARWTVETCQVPRCAKEDLVPLPFDLKELKSGVNDASPLIGPMNDTEQVVDSSTHITWPLLALQTAQ